MEAQLLHSPMTLSSLRADWERLYAARPHEPAVSYEWTRALLAHRVNEDDEIIVMACRNGAELQALLPLVRERHRVAGLPVMELRVLSEISGTHSDLLCRRLDPPLLELILECCRSEAPRWDFLRFSRVLEGSPLDRAIAAALPGLRLGCHSRLEPPSYFLRLPASFDAYLMARSGKFRNYLRRAERKLERRGGAWFWKLESDAQFTAAYQSLLEIEQASWKHAHGTAISSIEHQQHFYHALARDALAAGRLHLTFLEFDGRPAAYNLGVVSHGRYFYLKTSFIEDYRADGLATVSRARLIERLIEEQINEFDFPGEPYEWERQWADELRWHRSVLICNRGLMGRLVGGWSALSDRVGRRRGSRTLVHHDPRSLKPPPQETR